MKKEQYIYIYVERGLATGATCVGMSLGSTAQLECRRVLISLPKTVSP